MIPPPDDSISPVADAFSISGGDIKTTLRALFGTEAFQSSRDNLFKRPWRFVVSALRATNAQSNVGEPVVEFLRRMGHAPFQYPTPDGYPIESDPWMGTLLWRWNFALDLTTGRIEGSAVDASKLLDAHDDLDQTAAQFLGRIPTLLEAQVLRETSQPIALLLASPAFQRY